MIIYFTDCLIYSIGGDTMPLMRCEIEGKDGWKWGASGTCYVGPEAKEKALEQGKAIEASKAEETKDEEPFVSIIDFKR